MRVFSIKTMATYSMMVFIYMTCPLWLAANGNPPTQKGVPLARKTIQHGVLPTSPADPYGSDPFFLQAQSDIKTFMIDNTTPLNALYQLQKGLETRFNVVSEDSAIKFLRLGELQIRVIADTMKSRSSLDSLTIEMDKLRLVFIRCSQDEVDVQVCQVVAIKGTTNNAPSDGRWPYFIESVGSVDCINLPGTANAYLFNITVPLNHYIPNAGRYEYVWYSYASKSTKSVVPAYVACAELNSTEKVALPPVAQKRF